MYTIEYYKTKKEKPTIKEPKYSSNSKRINYMKRRRYLHQKDLIDKCWNIKSLTIDIEDIKYIIYDRKLRKLYSLYARVQRAKLDDNINSITILNNNSLNLMFIYEIINCEWMINQEEMLDSLDTLKISRQLYNRMQEYEATNNPKIKKDIEILIDYYINTIIIKNKSEQEFGVKTLKLGKHFIRQKNELFN